MPDLGPSACSGTSPPLPRSEAFFLDAAARLPGGSFLLGGNGWHDKPMPAKVRTIGHVGTANHNAFNCSASAVLGVAHDSVVAIGFSPANRVFEAAGAGTCLITDTWYVIELFLKPNYEILVACDGQDIAAHLAALTPKPPARQPAPASPPIIRTRNGRRWWTRSCRTGIKLSQLDFCAAASGAIQDRWLTTPPP